ncbi:MAG: Ribosomal RNA small subunit methyltransferase H [Chlamydiia bacterium]|nr:Ribosomal RNA small subunit methyltransferase H [Chlamydiia bacterium]
MQFDQAERGFSFAKDGPLDMRMDPTEDLTAEAVVNNCSEEELGRIFRELGEERFWKKGARAIIEARREKQIKTTRQLASIIENEFPNRGKIHPATRIFQGLRICVNKELDVIEKTIKKALDRLAPGGRIGVISFHSLEDRIVKHVFKSAAKPTRNMRGQVMNIAKVKELTKKPLIPSQKELRNNRRSRSAKLRFVEKL